MISTRAHAAIDHGAAALMLGLAAAPGRPRGVRRLLGATGAAHAGYSLLTDYEGGALPWITMRRHRQLDLLAAAGLCGAALALRLPRESRLLLGGLGVAEIAVIAASSTRPRRGPPQRALLQAPVGYAPLDVPKPVAEGVFVVDSLLRPPAGAVLAARMTVIRLPDGGLLLHSPTRHGAAVRAAVEALGPVRHIVAPSFAHWLYVRDWQRACPQAVTWAVPGLRERAGVRRSKVRLDHDLGETPPAAWGGAIEVTIVPGGLGWREAALFHRPTRTLVLTDLVVDVEAGRVPRLVRPVARLLGIVGPGGMAPAYLRAIVSLRRRDAARAAARLVGFAPARVIFAHGRWFADDAMPALRRSLRWLLE